MRRLIIKAPNDSFKDKDLLNIIVEEYIKDNINKTFELIEESADLKREHISLICLLDIYYDFVTLAFESIEDMPLFTLPATYAYGELLWALLSLYSGNYLSVFRTLRFYLSLV